MSEKLEHNPYKDSHRAQQRDQYHPPLVLPHHSHQQSSSQPPTPSHQQHPQGGYPVAQQSPYHQQHPSPSYGPPPPNDMLTLPPPPPNHMAAQQDPYRPPHGQYDPYQQQAQHGQMPYPPQHQGPHQQPPVNFAQPAPRQRTAIACRYCRRRKIRCHGFDLSPDGRCTNCARFHQDCIFTPVSSQAHAFVPAHTAYPHLRNQGRMPQPTDGRQMYAQGQPPIYSAHGQPLPMPQQGQEGSYPPPPQSGYGPGPYHYDERGPPPHGQEQSRGPPPQRRSSNAAYEYPDPTQMAPISPANSTPTYAPGPYPPQGQQQQPYYPSQPPPRRASPQSYGGGYDARSSTSPHGSSSSASGYPASSPAGNYPASSSASGYAPYGGLHPPQTLPPAKYEARTPPPSATRETNGTSTNGQRPGMSVRDILGPGDNSGGRTSADSDMVKALNRRGM